MQMRRCSPAVCRIACSGFCYHWLRLLLWTLLFNTTPPQHTQIKDSICRAEGGIRICLCPCSHSWQKIHHWGLNYRLDQHFCVLFFLKLRNIAELWVLLHTGYPQSEAPVTCLQGTENLLLCTAAIIGLLITSSKKVDHPGPTGAPGAFATVNLWAGAHQAMA